LIRNIQKSEGYLRDKSWKWNGQRGNE